MHKPMVEVIGLTKQYGRKRVLENFSLEAYAGEILGIQGPSGIGKTTLLKCIAGIEPFQEGTILIDALPIQEAPHRAGMVFQDYHLWPHMTVLENIIEAPLQVQKKTREEAMQIAKELLTQFNMEAQATHYPHQLSGGQQQRAALARALATNPSVLLLDEVTAALDPKLVNDLGKYLRALAKEGKAIIVVSHQKGFLKKVADRIEHVQGVGAQKELAK